MIQKEGGPCLAIHIHYMLMITYMHHHNAVIYLFSF